MKIFSSAIGAMLFASVAAASLAAPVYAADKKQEAPKGKISPTMQKVLAELQTLVAAKSYDAAKAKVVDAEAIHPRNSYDDFFIAQFRISIGQAQNDQAYMKPGLETFATSEFTPPEARKQVITVLMQTAYNNKESATFKTYADMLTKLEPTNPEPSLLQGQVFENDKKFAEADSSYVNAIRLTEASGKVPPEDYYVHLAGVREHSKSPQLEDSLRQLVNKYPSTRNWQFLIQAFQQRTKLVGRAGIDVYRLMAVTNTLNNQGDYIEYAESAKSAGVPGEAKSVLEKAMAANIFDAKGKPIASSDLTLFRTLAASDLKTLPAFAAQAKASASGDLDVTAGNGYLGHGENAQAVETFKRALSKGGFVKKSASEATMRLGIAQFRSGDKAGALATFSGFKSSDSNMNDLAAMWVMALK